MRAGPRGASRVTRIHDEQTADAVIEICQTLDGLPLGIELAAARMAAMSAAEVRDRLDRPDPVADRARARARPVRRRCGTRWRGPTTCSTRTSARSCARRRCSRAASTSRSLCAVAGQRRRRRGAPASWTRWCASRWSSPITAPSRPATASTTPSGCSPRTSSPKPAARGDVRDRHAAYFARRGASVAGTRWNGPEWRDHVDWVQAELANLRSAYRWSARARPGRDGHRRRRARRADGLLGGAVRDRRLGRGAARRRAGGRCPRGCPGCTPRRGTPASSGGPRPRPRNAHRATELESRPGYESCEPGYASLHRGTRRRSTAGTSTATSS